MKSVINSPIDIEKIFQEYNDKIYGFVLKNVGDPHLAKDLTQEIFLKICLKQNRFSEIEDVSNYIYLMTRNIIVDHFRKIANEKKYRKSLKEQFFNPVDKVIHKNHYITVLDDALDQLPPRQKTIYVMHRQEGISLKEISASLGISYFTVKNHLAEARKNLKKSINPEMIYGLVGVVMGLF